MGASFLDRLDVRSALAIIMTSSVMAMAFLLAVTRPDSDIFKIMLGTIIGSAYASIMNWYYGSSSGSAMKDEALAKTAQSQTETIAAQSTALATSVPVTQPDPNKPTG